MALLLATPLAAQADSATEYRAAITTALAELELGNYVEAQAQFEYAHSLSPSARTLRGLGIVAFEMKRYVEAETHLQAALVDPRKPLSEHMRLQTEQLLARTRRYLGTLQLAGVPADAELLLDDRKVGQHADGEYRLAIGDHTLQVVPEGQPARRRQFRLSSGKTLRIDLDLTPARQLPLTPPTETSAAMARPTERHSDAEYGRDEESTLWTSPWLWTTVGVVVAGATVGTILALSGSDTGVESPYGGTSGVPIQAP